MKNLKTTFTLLLVVASATLGMSQYHPLINEANAWSGIVYGMYYEGFYEFMQGDVVIGTTTYKQVWESQEIDGVPMLIGLIREDEVEQKVYQWVDGTEYLLYDFSAEVGDVVTLQYNEITITAVETILVNGTERKKLIYDDGWYPTYSIEGIGSAHRLMEILIGKVFDYGPTLACFKESGVEVWSNPEVFEGCDFIIGIDQRAAANCKIWPNPASDVLNISTDKQALGVCQLNLSSAFGQIVHTEQVFLTGSDQIELPELCSGVYFLSLISNQHVIATARVVRD